MAEPFNARLQRLLSNSGMTQKELAAQAGVTEAAVSHKTGTAVVTLNKEVSDEDLKQAVADQGIAFPALL